MSSVGRRLLSAVIYSNDVHKLLDLNLFPELFKESEMELYQCIKSHVIEYGVIPSQSTVEAKLGDVLIEAPEPCAFYGDEIEKRYLQEEMKKIVVKANGMLNEKKPDQAFTDLLDMVSTLAIKKNRQSILDFRDVAETIKGEYLKANFFDEGHVATFGWDTPDNMSGGIREGDVCSIVGRPASGKTFLGIRTGLHNWHQGVTPLVLSMEMTNLAIAQRLASMQTKHPLTQILKSQLTEPAQKKVFGLLSKLKENQVPFWLIDGNLSATVDQLVMWCRQLKPKLVVIDGAYLLRNPNSKASRFEKLTDNAEQIKQRVATDMKIPVVCSYQFSRTAVTKKHQKGFEHAKAGLEDIYGSDAIGQLSSMVFGLFQHENIETEKRRKIDIIKGRNGETGEFLINWDFIGMDFDEVATKKDDQGNLVEVTENLQFLD